MNLVCSLIGHRWHVLDHGWRWVENYFSPVEIVRAENRWCNRCGLRQNAVQMSQAEYDELQVRVATAMRNAPERRPSDYSDPMGGCYG